VAVGQYVPQGTLLARVQFTGAPHVHFDRFHLPPGGSWRNFGDPRRVQPDGFFAHTDTEAPIFEGGFRYLAAETDSVVAIGGATVPVVGGAVDIAVGLRDPAPLSRPAPQQGDRFAVTTLQYAVANAAGDTVRRGALDLRTIQIPRLGFREEWRVARTMVAPYEPMAGPGAPGWFQTRTTYYIVTNLPADARAGLLEERDASLSWRTNATNAAGQPEFPNGVYTVVVRAADFKGNTTVRVERVRVANAVGG